MLLFVCVFLATGTVGAAACFGVGVGAGTLKLFLLLKEHLYPQTGHHQSHNGYGYSQHYQYRLCHIGKQKRALFALFSLLPLKDLNLRPPD